MGLTSFNPYDIIVLSNERKEGFTMTILYQSFEKFINVIEYLEDNDYLYKWKQMGSGYEIIVNY